MQAVFAVPGDLAAPTGGYAYARALLASAGAAGMDLSHLPLPGGYPFPSAAEIGATRAAFAAARVPILADGLALGAMPVAAIAAATVPVVALCHHPLGMESGLDPERAAALIASETAALAAVRAVIVTSETTATTLVERFGVARGRITVAVPGLSRAPVAPRTGNPPVILSVGSLTFRKGHDVLIRALSHLKDLAWTARIAGTGDRGGDWAQTLEAMIARAGLSDRIALLGAQGPEAMEALYAGADLFCLPSRYEGYGMVFAEAMMRGLPVVGARAGAVPEVVPPAAGLLAPVDDDVALADFLGLLLTSRAVADRMAAAARAQALTLPDWPDTARVIAGVMAGCR